MHKTYLERQPGEEIVLAGKMTNDLVLLHIIFGLSDCFGKKFDNLRFHDVFVRWKVAPMLFSISSKQQVIKQEETKSAKFTNPQSLRENQESA